MDYDNDNNNVLNVSEESLFHKDPYFQKEIYEKKEENSEIIINKNELIIREKLMYFYLNPRKNIAMPKFMKFSEKEKRCKQILTFTDISLQQKIHNFYDGGSYLKCRKFFYKYVAYINKYSLKLVKNPINPYSSNMKDLEEFEFRNFTYEDDNENIDTKTNFRKNTNASRNSFNASGNKNNNPLRNSKNSLKDKKYMPDHVASKLVDDILNDKFD